MKTNILTLVITLTLGTILAGSLLMPVISETQTNLGDVTTINNENNQPTADYTNRDIVMTITAANDDDGYAIYVNDVGYEKPALTRIALISDRLIIYATSVVGRSVELRYWDDANSTEVSTNVTADVTVGYTHTTRTLTYSDGTRDITYTDVPYVFCWDKDGQYGEVLNNNTYPSKVFRMSDIENGNWGVFDTAGAFTINGVTHQGIITASKYGVTALFADNPDWTVTLDYGTPTLKEGTTDLYNGLAPKFIITDTEGNFTESGPSRSFVLNEAHGHESAGAAYSLLGAIPIMVIIGLVLAATAAIMVKRND